MTPNRAALVIAKYGKHIPNDCRLSFCDLLEQADDACLDALMMTPVKKKLDIILFSIFLGRIGVDRFYVGDVGLGILKILFNLLTKILWIFPILGNISNVAFLIWHIVDIFITYKIAERINYDRLAYTLIRYSKNTDEDEDLFDDEPQGSQNGKESNTTNDNFVENQSACDIQGEHSAVIAE